MKSTYSNIIKTPIQCHYFWWTWEADTHFWFGRIFFCLYYNIFWLFWFSDFYSVKFEWSICGRVFIFFTHLIHTHYDVSKINKNQVWFDRGIFGHFFWQWHTHLMVFRNWVLRLTFLKGMMTMIIVCFWRKNNSHASYLVLKTRLKRKL